MGQHHDHGPVTHHRAFAIGVTLKVAYAFVEATYGLLTGSLALLADAAHSLSDTLGLLLAWGAAYLMSLKPTGRYTYGWRSSSILAALMNGLILLAAMGGISWEAIRRFWEPQEIAGTTVMWVAGLGVLINGFTALLFVKGHKEDLNIKGAFLHTAADAAISFGVVLAGLGILLTGQAWIDPAVSLLVAATILWTTWDLLKDSFNLAMHAVPKEIDAEAVEAYLGDLPGVSEVHDLHIWAMSTRETALTVHLVKPQIGPDDDSLLCEIAAHLHDRFRIGHSTVQIERSPETVRCLQRAESREGGGL